MCKGHNVDAVVFLKPPDFSAKGPITPKCPELIRVRVQINEFAITKDTVKFLLEQLQKVPEARDIAGLGDGETVQSMATRIGFKVLANTGYFDKKVLTSDQAERIDLRTALAKNFSTSLDLVVEAKSANTCKSSKFINRLRRSLQYMCTFPHPPCNTSMAKASEQSHMMLQPGISHTAQHSQACTRRSRLWSPLHVSSVSDPRSSILSCANLRKDSLDLLLWLFVIAKLHVLSSDATLDNVEHELHGIHVWAL